MDEWTNGRFGVFRWCYGEEGGKISAMIEYTIIIIILYINNIKYIACIFENIKTSIRPFVHSSIFFWEFYFPAITGKNKVQKVRIFGIQFAESMIFSYICNVWTRKRKGGL